MVVGSCVVVGCFAVVFAVVAAAGFVDCAEVGPIVEVDVAETSPWVLSLFCSSLSDPCDVSLSSPSSELSETIALEPSPSS